MRPPPQASQSKPAGFSLIGFKPGSLTQENLTKCQKSIGEYEGFPCAGLANCYTWDELGNGVPGIWSQVEFPGAARCKILFNDEEDCSTDPKTVSLLEIDESCPTPTPTLVGMKAPVVEYVATATTVIGVPAVLRRVPITGWLAAINMILMSAGAAVDFGVV